MNELKKKQKYLVNKGVGDLKLPRQKHIPDAISDDADEYQGNPGGATFISAHLPNARQVAVAIVFHTDFEFFIEGVQIDDRGLI